MLWYCLSFGISLILWIVAFWLIWHEKPCEPDEEETR